MRRERVKASKVYVEHAQIENIKYIVQVLLLYI